MICKKELCSGCYACYNICPKNAIYMKEDPFGFKYPFIDKSKCINCGLCRKVCQSLNKLEYNEVKECYAAYSKDEKIHSNSTSGGIATILSKEIIKKDGIVFGVTYDVKNKAFNHKRCTSFDDLKDIQGSKYVQSDMNNTYNLVREDLLNKRIVLFIGTPCQISGLKLFLAKEYDNLYLIDLVCHGVSSKKILDSEIGFKDYSKIRFRFNNKYQILAKSNNRYYQADLKNSPYLRFFLNSYSLRESCTNCFYSKSDRVSDITIGDFWGLDKISDFGNDRNKGVSLVLINTQKGKNTFNEICKNIEFEKHDYKIARIKNQPLNRSIQNRTKLTIFRISYKIIGLRNTYKLFKILKKGEM